MSGDAQRGRFYQGDIHLDFGLCIKVGIGELLAFWLVGQQEISEAMMSRKWEKERRAGGGADRGELIR
jgi:hypothetical protein